ncbi:MAG: amidohydrolase [Thalassobaculum sp.]|uniref:amidohydrolase n=1 Tax=Thalassobaculum sp. TaxID=2022740 RepID=UPI0032ECF422
MARVQADTVLTGGKVYLGPGLGFAEAVATFAGRVLATGSTAEIAALAGPGTARVDLAGRLALPGLNDAHQHMMSVGMGTFEVNLKRDDIRTVDHVLAAIRAKVDEVGPGNWVFGRGYDHFELDVKRHPLREELDQVAPDNPVYIKRTCGHMGVANSKALELAGIREGVAQPAGGHVEAQNGKLTGLLQETAQQLVYRAFPAATFEDFVTGIEAGARLNLSYGITSCTDPGVGLREGYKDWQAYVAARRQGRLPVRMYLMMLAGATGWPDRVVDMDLMTGDGDEWMRVGCMKLFADGSAGGKTAAMSQPYADDSENRGIFICGDEEIHGMIADYHARGFQVATHAIGDAAIEQVLSGYEKAMGNSVDTQRRHRIEHCGFLSQGQIDRMARVGVLPAPQPIFLYEFGDLYVDALGHGRPEASYPMRRWLDAGLRPSASSDGPVSSTNPFRGLYTMVTRRTNKGTVLGADERLNLEEAIAAYTVNSAYGSFEEGIKGTLAPGMLADVAVLDTDLFATEPTAWLQAQADLTIVGGRVEYDRLGQM